VSGALTVPALRAGLARIAVGMDAASGELNELDGALGDGDLGVTMVRGMRAILTEADAFPDDLGAAFMKCAQGFTKTSGSTFGTLMATGLMAAAKATKGKTRVEWTELSGLVGTALDAMASRGKAELGDKTVLDALDGVRRALQPMSDATGDASRDAETLRLAALAGVRASLDDLRPRAARQGRARIFGEKTVGKDDPGMIAILRIVEALGA
jgi:dihydroxyacetone kinase-like protein